MLRGICKKENFLDLLENFILFDHSGGKTVKILARNHQYLGVNEAVKAYEARKLNNGKLGVFWHTQGSGKSYSMVFLSQKIRRKFAGSPTIVVLTDREELNSQISDTFENCGLLGKTKASKFIATSGEDLIDKLRGNPSFIFTLIQKFNKKVEEPIIPDHDIIIMSDEAHRSQYGIFADNMVGLLPTASRIGFTGTPLLSNDNITERTFGGYISIYDFKRAVEDKATVPLYYENRGEKILDIHNPDITDKILDAIEAADLDPEQEEKLEHEFEKEIHLLTAEPRLKSVARDFVSHYSDLWTSGKQERDLLKFIKEDKHFCRYYDAIYILLNTGLRISEFCGLTISDLEFDQKRIKVDHQLQRTSQMQYVIQAPKTESGIRYVPMSEEVVACFRRILANRVAPKIEPMVDGYAGFLFLDKNDKPMVALHWEKYLEHIIEKYNKIYRIQMPKVTPHVCRHTFCSNMAKSGMNPKTLQYIMGHSDISVTLNVYTHVQFDDAQAELLRVAKA